MDKQAVEKRTCMVRKKVIVDARVIAEFPVSAWEYAKYKDGKYLAGTPEDFGKCLEGKCEEFRDFLRDHRSQDLVSLSVERETKDLCSACGEHWETDVDEETGEEYCASCGAIVETALDKGE